MQSDVFTELSIILAIALVVSGIIRILKQPAIIGYIASGIIVGPFVLDIIDSASTFETFSQIGVALLLFFVGLNLNPKVVKDVGIIALVTGLGQVIFTAGIGFFIASLFGFSLVASIYIALALAFSSTIIIMKLLSDKRDMETLYGKISVGFLIIQDFIAIFILLAVSSLNGGSNVLDLVFNTVMKGALSVIVLFLITIHVLPKITKFMARSQEHLLLFSISWCFIIATTFYYLDFSIEAGALLAGIALSMSPYHYEISSKLKPIRDFFLVLFFIMLGSHMTFGNMSEHFLAIIAFSIFVLIGNPIIVMVLMGALGYTKRNGFLAGLTVAQISEFSFIVLGLGMTLGHVSKEIVSLVTVVGLITFTGSTYMIIYSNRLYQILSPYLKIFEKRGKKKDEYNYKKEKGHEIVLFGYNRIGFDILESLNKIKRRFLIVDYNPDTIIDLSKKGFDCIYGDADDSELLNEINLHKVKMVVSTVPEIDTNILIIKKVLEQNAKAIIAVVSHQIDEAERLYEEGATYVIMPHFLGGKHFSTMLEKNKLSLNNFLKEKIAHLEHLNYRKSLGHNHPVHADN